MDGRTKKCKRQGSYDRERTEAVCSIHCGPLFMDNVHELPTDTTCSNREARNVYWTNSQRPSGLLEGCWHVYPASGIRNIKSTLQISSSPQTREKNCSLPAWRLIISAITKHLRVVSSRSALIDLKKRLRVRPKILFDKP